MNALASVLDKHREVSIQEAVYRLLSLPMTKSSVIVKYLSTVHPHFRDGLLKGNLDELDEDEPIFHNSPFDYYENRPENSDEPNVDYEEEEQVEDFWENLSITEFWSKYDIVYTKADNTKKKKRKTKIKTLKNGKGFIRKRSKQAVLRYYLNSDNDEDFARGLLILFMPFRNEMDEIHRVDVKQLLKDKKDLIQEKRSYFEKYKIMTDLILNIQVEIETNTEKNGNDDPDNEDLETETT